MHWNRRYLILSYARSSLWLVPFFAVLAYMAANRITFSAGRWLLQNGYLDEKTAFLGLSMAGARTMLETVITLNLSFVVFTFGSLLVAIQVAGGQYTPRIIATTLLRNNAIRCTVGYFVFTLLFALRVLSRMGDEIVHQFNTFIAATFGLVSIVVFLYLIDYAARLLRPVSLVHRVGESGIGVIKNVYPESTDSSHTENSPGSRSFPERVVTNAGSSGIVLAIDLEGLVERARRADGVIEFIPQVGDFVAADEPLFRLYGGAAGIDDRELQASVALGSERTLEQDPTFAFRILVDIAIKALSPAINDPTTAVLAIDQLNRLLRLVGMRRLQSEVLLDGRGSPRVVFRTPNWEDFVQLACTEIRHFGVGSIQIMRRMRSMLENLSHILPPHRHPELRRQLQLLDSEIDGHYTLADDRALARIADPQGLGGSVGIRPAAEPQDGSQRP